MKKILSIIVINLLIFCSFGVQGLSKQNNDLQLQNLPDYYFNMNIHGNLDTIVEKELSSIKDKFPSHVNISIPNQSLPDYFNWKDYNGKDWITPIRQQLMGDCGVFSALGALESIIKIRENCADINPDLSEQYFLSCLPQQQLNMEKVALMEFFHQMLIDI